MNELLNYLSIILNREINDKTIIGLSSAQRIKLHTWLIESKIEFNANVLRNSFRAKDLLNYQDNFNLPENKQTQIPSNFDSLSVGIDIESLSEFCEGVDFFDPKEDPFLNKVFTLREISYSQTRDSIRHTLAGIFSAKEAIIKCGEIKDLREIEINHHKNNRPYYPGFILSISHSKDYAIAVAAKYDDFSNQINLPVTNFDNIAPPNKGFFLRRFRLFDLFVLMSLILLFLLSAFNLYKF